MKGTGIMFTFSPREYSIRELFDSYKRKETILSPKFQRRSVWELKAKSYLIDSILRGLPIPRIFIREKTNIDLTAVREIVDGQQRLKAIFDFIQDGFKINKIHNAEYGDKSYSDLPDDVKSDFLKYSISAVMLIDLADEDIIDIFARLNTYSVKLNAQEQLNSQYFGLYKQLVYRLAAEYRTFWIESNLISEKGISRMEDAKMITELLAVIVTGKITSNSIENNSRLYKTYDDEFPKQASIEKNLKTVIDLISRLFDDNIKETAYSKIPLFYSLVLVLYHMFDPISDFTFPSIAINEDNIPKLKTALEEIDAIVCNDNQKYEDFIVTLNKNTTTPNVRMHRCEFMGHLIVQYLS